MESPGSEYRLGVLLVHGIGTQPLGETIVHWGDAIVAGLPRSTGGRVTATLGHAGPDPSCDPAIQTEAVLEVAHDSGSERWLIAEGWWANAFAAPSYAELVSWSLQALPWALIIHVTERVWAARGGGRNPLGSWVRVSTSVKLALIFLLAPVLVATLLTGLVLGLLPIPQLRSAILAAQGTLTSTVGDSLAFVDSPMRAALIRSRVSDAIRRIKRKCERTIVIAHSQGAAIVLDVLGGFALATHTEPAVAAPAAPNTLLTFGAGTNKLGSMKRVREASSNPEVISPVAYPVAGALVAAGAVGYLYTLLRRGQLTFRDLVLAALAFGAFSVITSLLAVGLVFLDERIAKRRPELAPYIKWGSIVILTALLLVLVGYGARFAWLDRFPIGAIGGILFGFLLVFGTIVKMRSDETGNALTCARRPPGVERWIDIYASADPVPNGATRTTDSGPQSLKIFNRGATFEDHTRYWNNLDCFVAAVVGACASTARSEWAGLVMQGGPEELERASQRARRLSFARSVLWISWLAIGWLAWPFARDFLDVRSVLPSWTPRSMVAPIVYVMMIGVAVRLTYLLASVGWEWWARTDQTRFFLGGAPERWHIGALWTEFIACTAAAGALVLAAARARVSDPWCVLELATIGGFGMVLMFGGEFALLAHLILNRLDRRASRTGQGAARPSEGRSGGGAPGSTSPSPA